MVTGQQRLLLLFGGVGSLMGVVIPIVTYYLTWGGFAYYPYGLLNFILVYILTGLWLAVQSFGFFGLYRSFDELMGIIAFVFTLIAAATEMAVGTLSLGYGYPYYYVASYLPAVYQIVATTTQACTFILIGRSTRVSKLFIATAIALLAAGSISWLTIGIPLLSVSNVFVAMCFFIIMKGPRFEPKPEPESVDLLRAQQ
jgi:hypothetical protein